MAAQSPPLITIITSTFNAEGDFSFTAASIRNQKYKNIQWIVIDGGSTDSTVDLIRKNEDIIDYWLSEPDSGIYDAWNKACRHIRGEWVQFLGAGDEYPSHDTLDQVAPYLIGARNYEIVYGRLQYITEYSREVIEEVGKPWSEIKGKWEIFRPVLPLHPEVFHHSSLFTQEMPFDIKYKFAGDTHFLLKSILRKDPLYIPVVIDRMALGGVSSSPRKAYLRAKEIFRINQELGIKPPFIHKMKEYIKLYTIVVVVNAFGEKGFFWVADLYRICLGKSRRWTL
ncbi:MAG: glycosyltransferase family 2 protein [Gammaproteobacteria bacterium]